MDTKKIEPLYTSIKTEYLRHLMSCEYAAKTIRTDHLQTIADAVTKAKSKHPHFVPSLTDMGFDECKMMLECTRHENDMDAMNGRETAMSVLLEEMLEAVEAYLSGDKKSFIREMGDTVAVCLRIMEKFENE